MTYLAVLGLAASALSDIQGWVAYKTGSGDDEWAVSVGNANNIYWSLYGTHDQVVVCSNSAKCRIDDASFLADFFKLIEPLHNIGQERQKLAQARNEARASQQRATMDLEVANRSKVFLAGQRERTKDEEGLRRIDDNIKDKDKEIADKEAIQKAEQKKTDDADLAYTAISKKRQDARDRICPDAEKLIQSALDKGLGKKTDIDGFSILRAGKGGNLSYGWGNTGDVISYDWGNSGSYVVSSNPEIDHDQLILNANGIQYRIEEEKIINDIFNLLEPLQQKEKERQAYTQDRQKDVQAAREANSQLKSAQRNKANLDRQRARSKDEGQQRSLDSEIASAQQEIGRLDVVYQEKLKAAPADEDKEKRTAFNKDMQAIRRRIFPDIEKILQDAYDRKIGKRIW